MFLRDKSQPATELADGRIVLDVSKLKDNERLEFQYDHNQKLIAVQKITLTNANKSMEARVEMDIQPGGYGRVMYQGNSWKAWSDYDGIIEKGSKVLVLGQHGITLLVTPSA